MDKSVARQGRGLKFCSLTDGWWPGLGIWPLFYLLLGWVYIAEDHFARGGFLLHQGWAWVRPLPVFVLRGGGLLAWQSGVCVCYLPYCTPYQYKRQISCLLFSKKKNARCAFSLVAINPSQSGFELGALSANLGVDDCYVWKSSSTIRQWQEQSSAHNTNTSMLFCLMGNNR